MGLDNTTVLDQVLCEGTADILTSYGVAVQAMDPTLALQMEEHDGCGVIGFTGDKARGTLVIATSLRFVWGTCSAMQAEPREDELRDWLAELANLVLGRVKIGLHRHGLDVRLRTPVALSGQRLRLGSFGGGIVSAWDFGVAGAPLRLWIDVELDEDVVLNEASTEPAIQGGDLLLF